MVNIVRSKQVGSPSTKNTQIVDVRSTGEVAGSGMIPYAINIPLAVLSDVLASDGPVDDEDFEEVFGVERPVPGVTQMVFYCAHGVRSATAVEIAEQNGYTGALNFSGSWAQWQKSFSVENADVTETAATTCPSNSSSPP